MMKRGENMIELYVCMGSACYLKGSTDIIEILKEELQKNNLLGIIHMRGSFCLGPCNQGVVIKVGNRFFKNVSPQNIKSLFENEIMPFIKNDEPSERTKDDDSYV